LAYTKTVETFRLISAITHKSITRQAVSSKRVKAAKHDRITE